MRGELDWIVMKALEKDRARRYETANGLARDVQRYLADELVEARPPSAGYRLRKFVRRHKGQVIAASLVRALSAGGDDRHDLGLPGAERAWNARSDSEPTASDWRSWKPSSRRPRPTRRRRKRKGRGLRPRLRRSPPEPRQTRSS